MLFSNETAHIFPTLSLSLEKSVYRLKTTQLSSSVRLTKILYTWAMKGKQFKKQTDINVKKTFPEAHML